MEAPLKQSGRYSLELESLAMGGEAVGRVDNFVVFVPEGVPGDQVEIDVVELKPSYARGRIVNIIRPSPHRLEPRCPITRRCGGCQLQHMTYELQVQEKTRMVRDVLERVGKVAKDVVADCIPAPNPWLYRNKMQLVAAAKPFMHGQDRSGRPYFGLYIPRSHTVVRMERCEIQHPLNATVLRTLGDAVGKLGWEIYEEKSGRGFLRHVLARVGTAREEMLLVLVTTGGEVPQYREFVSSMRRKVPSLVGVVQNINPRRTNVVLGNQNRILWGRDHVVEQLGELKFKISATSFFQVNTAMAEKLQEQVLGFADLRGREQVVDAYCGVGAISLTLAGKARKVIGIESSAAAVADAWDNAELNNIRNVDFQVGVVEKAIPALYQGGARAELVILDPPRQGVDNATLRALAGMRVPRIIYVSCKPDTLARDLAALGGQGYVVRKVQPMDMFPQTAHVEVVALVEKV